MRTSKLVTAGTAAALTATAVLLGPLAGTASGGDYFTATVESCWPQIGGNMQEALNQSGVKFTVPAGCQAGVTYRVSANLVHRPCEPDGSVCTNPDDTTTPWHPSLDHQTLLEAVDVPATHGGAVNVAFTQICAGSHNGLLLQIDVGEVESGQAEVNVTHRYGETAGCVEAGPPTLAPAVAPAEDSLGPAGGPDVLPAIAPLPDNAGPDTLGAAAVPEGASTPVAATTVDVSPAAVEAPPHVDSVQVESSTGTYIDQPVRVSNAAATSQTGALPHTGASHTRGIVAAGLAALAAGGGLVAGFSRRRRTA